MRSILTTVLFLSGLMLGIGTLSLDIAAQDTPKQKVKDKAKKLPKDAPDKAETPVEAFDQAKADRETLQQAGIAVEGKAILEFFERHTVSDADRARIAMLLKQLGSRDFDQRQAASEELEKYGVAAIGLLRQGERDSDPEISRRCERCLQNIEKVPTRTLAAASARLLAQLKPEGTTKTLMNYLPLSDDDSVTEEILLCLAANAMRNGKPDPVLMENLQSKEIIKRGAAAEALARGGDGPTRDAIKKFMKTETSPEIQIRIALGLVTGVAKDKSIVPELIRLMAEVPNDIGWRAEEVLCRMAGETGPNVSLGNDVVSKQKAREEWKNWWDKNGEKVDISKLDEAERMLGYTLVIEYDIRGIGGRVAELTPDGKKRWEVGNLQFPTDAVVLPGNRVIIAEQNTNRISERDTGNGKEVWGETVNQPIALQRLPNGNIVVTCRNEIFEWDRNRKKVISIPRQNFDIVAGTKLRNGQFLVMTQIGDVIRYEKDGKQVKSFRVTRPNYNSTVQALPNNKVLITEQRQVREYDLEAGAAGTWSHNFYFPTSAYRLPNGNTLIASQNTNTAVEVDRNGKTVWEYKSTSANLRPWKIKRR